MNLLTKWSTTNLMIKTTLQLTVSPEYLDALTQLNANLAAVDNLLAANQQLLTEFLQRSPQLVKLPLESGEPTDEMDYYAENIQQLS